MTSAVPATRPSSQETSSSTFQETQTSLSSGSVLLTSSSGMITSFLALIAPTILILLKNWQRRKSNY